MTEEHPIRNPDQYHDKETGYSSSYELETRHMYYADRYLDTEKMLEDIQDDRQLDEVGEEVLE